MSDVAQAILKMIKLKLFCFNEWHQLYIIQLMLKTDYLLINISLIKLEMKTILWVCVFVALGVCAVIDPPVAAAGGQVALFLLRIIEKYKCLSFYKTSLK